MRRARHKNRRESRDRREGCLILVILTLGILAVIGYGYVVGR